MFPVDRPTQEALHGHALNVSHGALLLRWRPINKSSSHHLFSRLFSCLRASSKSLLLQLLLLLLLLLLHRSSLINTSGANLNDSESTTRSRSLVSTPAHRPSYCLTTFESRRRTRKARTTADASRFRAQCMGHLCCRGGSGRTRQEARTDESLRQQTLALCTYVHAPCSTFRSKVHSAKITKKAAERSGCWGKRLVHSASEKVASVRIAQVLKGRGPGSESGRWANALRCT